MNKPLISVIVPIYNTEADYLKKCIDSVIGQDYEAVELILINDGSSNNAKEVCLEYMRHFSTGDIIEAATSENLRSICSALNGKKSIVLIDQDNSGVSVARNNGLDNATGEFVVFVDADDFISEGTFTHLMSKIDDTTDVLFFGYCTSYTNTEIIRVLDNPDKELFKRDALQLAILKGDKRLGPVEVGAPWGKLIRRSIIEEGTPARYIKGLVKGQDTVFSLYLLQRCRNIRYEAFVGYHYRISTSSVSHRFNPKIIDIMEKTLQAYENFVLENDKGDVFLSAVRRKYYAVLMGEYLDLYFINRFNKASEGQMKSEFLHLIEREPYRQLISELNIKEKSGVAKLELFLVKKKMLGFLFAERKVQYFLRRTLIKNYS